MYGKLTSEGDWPIVNGGSIMCFVPIIQSELKNPETKQRLRKAMKSHTKLQAKEAFIDLGISDIYAPKENFNHKSLENILHSIYYPAITTKEIPVIKHIIKNSRKMQQ